MTSEHDYGQCYVWIWLPEDTEPVVAGKLAETEGRIVFTYGRSYLERKDAIPIYDRELPLKPGAQEKTEGTEKLPGCLRDSAPDAWGRRVILNKLLGPRGQDTDPAALSELTYLMESGSDRIGALDFQASPTEYRPRESGNASLEELQYCAELVEHGTPLSPALAQALHHGTSIGGARPKALIDEDKAKYIAKFSSSTDLYNTIKAEFIAMRLARLCGLDVADVRLAQAAGRDVLLIKRFDRVLKNKGWSRKLILSALTLLGLDEMTARYASYQDLAEIIRHRFTAPKKTLEELFARLVFNILCGNTDDHARNHAAFWDGRNLELTPAYDICPQLRTGGEATQAMAITDGDKSSRLITCLSAASHFHLTQERAKEIVETQIETIRASWADVCEEARLSEMDEKLFSQRIFFNSYAFEGYNESEN